MNISSFNHLRRNKKYLGRKKKTGNTRGLPKITHPSTTLAQARLTAEF